jgi:hypothetical protein
MFTYTATKNTQSSPNRDHVVKYARITLTFDSMESRDKMAAEMPQGWQAHHEIWNPLPADVNRGRVALGMGSLDKILLIITTPVELSTFVSREPIADLETAAKHKATTALNFVNRMNKFLAKNGIEIN